VSDKEVLPVPQKLVVEGIIEPAVGSPLHTDGTTFSKAPDENVLPAQLVTKHRYPYPSQPEGTPERTRVDPVAVDVNEYPE
jgi:hypothetical protein